LEEQKQNFEIPSEINQPMENQTLIESVCSTFGNSLVDTSDSAISRKENPGISY